MAIPWGYRFHPLRLLALYYLRGNLSHDAIILEEAELRPRTPDERPVFQCRAWVTFKNVVHVTRHVHDYQPRLDTEDQTFEVLWDIHVEDIDRWQPKLELLSIRHLTQSFPSDIVLPQSRRYR